MQRAFDLAANGKLEVAPNPMVGAVIVYQDKVIAEGFHRQFGGAHAEIEALKQVKDQSILSEATLYVTLEPCSHQGKTPPCSQAIIRSGIKKVVVANLDPNPLVSGRGIEALKTAGIEVLTEVEASRGEKLNRRFFTFHRKQRPYIILKWAQNRRGEMGTYDELPAEKRWFTSPESKQLVHQWRAEEQAILVGRRTVELDDPTLNCREVSGKDPIRLIIDSDLSLSDHVKVKSGQIPTTIFNRKSQEVKNNVHYINLEFKDTVKEILDYCYEQQILSILVEGGSYTLQSFIDKNLWDEARIFTADNKFENPVIAPDIKRERVEILRLKEDLLEIYQAVP
jgi:diaminohydroxyphosphoribosylaminopyrimidine deaminase/5-amino-6-(5-phosphoribosylamino)uracil reductase